MPFVSQESLLLRLQKPWHGARGAMCQELMPKSEGLSGGVCERCLRAKRFAVGGIGHDLFGASVRGAIRPAKVISVSGISGVVFGAERNGDPSIFQRTSQSFSRLFG